MIETLQSAASLSERLRARIKRDGPITFRDWMEAALYDPAEGYYCRSDKRKWGREGDYRTSPERSSLFASTFARYFAKLYNDLSQPPQWISMEVGAGDGRFAAGVLKTLKQSFPDVFNATNYVVDEISYDSRSRARRRLEEFADRVEFGNLEDVVIDPGIVFSNELLDAFPVHRVIMDHGRFREMYVGLGSGDRFEWAFGPLSTSRLDAYIKDSGLRLDDHQIAEVNLAAEDWVETAAGKLRSGYMITVDYGAAPEDLHGSTGPYDRNSGTLRSFHRHQRVEDLLNAPGEGDLTTTINWSHIRAAGNRFGLQEVYFQQLDYFLLEAGLLKQLEIESPAAHNDAERVSLTTAAREMILPDGMASHFQVLVQKKRRD
jgi:SAM-dependent MidA family methyltransferase